MGGPIVSLTSGSQLIDSAFWGRYVSTFLLAWITGSVFYRMPLTTTGLVSAKSAVLICSFCAEVVFSQP